MYAERVNPVNTRLLGVGLVATATILWGVSGTVAQYLFQQRGISPEWLVDVRLLMSGILMLLFAKIKEKKNVFRIWTSKKAAISIVLFSIFGMLGVQYTYFAAIKESNAATATILQYLGPIFVTAFILIKSKRWPTKKEMLVMIVALLGTFLLVTNGDLGRLAISNWALFWGVLSALTLAFYTLQPINLIKDFGTSIVVGWGMLLGGGCMSFINPPWAFKGDLTGVTALAILFIIIFGTLIAFFCFLESLKYLPASDATVLSCMEPLSAAFLSVLWLKVSFGIGELLGASLILSTVTMLSYSPRKKADKRLEM